MQRLLDSFKYFCQPANQLQQHSHAMFSNTDIRVSIRLKTHKSCQQISECLQHAMLGMSSPSSNNGTSVSIPVRIISLHVPFDWLMHVQQSALMIGYQLATQILALFR